LLRTSLLSPRKSYIVPLPTASRDLRLGERTLVMGVVNVTPDSFADGGQFPDASRAIDSALRMEADGADLIDIGGESTRPGADPLPIDEELSRVVPVLRGVAARLKVPVSIDTYKAGVARVALEEGAAIVNDISGLRYDPALAEVVAKRRAGLVLMHTRGRSRDMYQAAKYESLMDEIADELGESVDVAIASGVARDAIVVDPGIGFAKKAEHSFAVLSRLAALSSLDRPILVGPSRKSFLNAALGDMPPAARLWGTAAAVTAAVLGGAHIVRVHDVAEMAQVVRVADRLRLAAEIEP
jgi:dihydropteroate synthase